MRNHYELMLLPKLRRKLRNYYYLMTEYRRFFFYNNKSLIILIVLSHLKNNLRGLFTNNLQQNNNRNLWLKNFFFILDLLKNSYPIRISPDKHSKIQVNQLKAYLVCISDVTRTNI